MHEHNRKKCCAAVAELLLHFWEREQGEYKGFSHWEWMAENASDAMVGDVGISFYADPKLAVRIREVLNRYDLTLLAIQEKYGVAFSVSNGSQMLTVELVHVEQNKQG